MAFLKYFVLIFLFESSAYAAPSITCPTVAEIRNNHFNRWLPLYKNNEELANKKDVEIFKKNITQFNAAIWNSSYLENGHCFYTSNNNITNKIILAHDAWRPTQTPNWRWLISNNLAECTQKNPPDCGFIT